MPEFGRRKGDLGVSEGEGAPADTGAPKAPVDEAAVTKAARYDELARWWRAQAESEIEQTVAKAIEYSATDLSDIGHDIARIAGRKVSDEEATELGIYFYLRGKLSRWTGAIINGERPSDDTIVDFNVYGRMAQRNREKGGWPGV